MTTAKTHAEVRVDRSPHRCGLIQIAAPWPKKGVNLGTLARTADAVGACMVLPHNSNAIRALKRGHTFGIEYSCITWIKDPIGWLAWEPAYKLAVEMAHGATDLRDLKPATKLTVVILGHETSGIPKQALDLCDEVVEIPQVGIGNCLNVAVAGSLVLYKLAGMI